MSNEMVSIMVPDNQKVYTKNIIELSGVPSVARGSELPLNSKQIGRISLNDRSSLPRSITNWVGYGSFLLDQNLELRPEDNERMWVQVDRENKLVTGVMEMAALRLNQSLVETIKEQRQIISDQASKLSEFERIRSFAPSGKLVLPDDYFEDLVE
jgi:hypothetical protein